MVISPVLNTCSPLQYCPSLDPCCSPAISGFGLTAVCGYCNFCTACDDGFEWPREELYSAGAFLAPTEALVVAAAFLVVSWLDLVFRNGLDGSAGAPLRGLDPVAGFEPDTGGLVPEAGGLDPAVTMCFLGPADFEPLTAGFCSSTAGCLLSG